jgi:hypothetical protein
MKHFISLIAVLMATTVVQAEAVKFSDLKPRMLVRIDQNLSLGFNAHPEYIYADIEGYSPTLAFTSFDDQRLLYRSSILRVTSLWVQPDFQGSVRARKLTINETGKQIYHIGFALLDRNRYPTKIKFELSTKADPSDVIKGFQKMGEDFLSRHGSLQFSRVSPGDFLMNSLPVSFAGKTLPPYSRLEVTDIQKVHHTYTLGYRYHLNAKILMCPTRFKAQNCQVTLSGDGPMRDENWAHQIIEKNIRVKKIFGFGFYY